ncbi:MAG: hypothetical protein ACR2IQ_02985 [Minisyncoccia bacterium]
MKIKISALVFVLVSFMFLGAFAQTAMASVTWNQDGVTTVKVGKTGSFANIYTTNETFSNGEYAYVQVYYHVMNNETATDARISLNQGGSTTSHTLYGGVYGGGSSATGSVTINTNTHSTLTLVAVRRWTNDGMGNQTNPTGEDVTGMASSAVNGGSYSLDTVSGNLNTQGAVVFKFLVNTTTNNSYQYACSDNSDNDGDGLYDMQDPGCSSSTDNDEYNYINNYNYVNNYNIPPTAYTGFATSITNTGAQLNGIGSPNGAYTTAWFEWGITNSLGTTTNTQNIGSSGDMYPTTFVSGLNPGTLYFYRLCVSNVNGQRCGDIVSFKTTGSTYVANNNVTPKIVYRDRVVSAPTVVNQQLVAASVTQGLVAIRVQDQGAERSYVSACIGDTFNYDVYYQNVSNKDLSNVILRVDFPEQINFVSSHGGTYSSKDNTVTYEIGTLKSGEQGHFYVTAKMSSLAKGKDLVVSTVRVVYTNPTTGAQEEAIGYALHKFQGCSTDTNLGAAALFGYGFFPTTLFGWLLLLLVILVLILVGRMVYDKTMSKKQTTTTI